MMYMCKEIKKENIVTMYDERVAELEHLLEKAQEDHAGLMRMYENANTRYLDDTNILAGVLRYVIEGSLEKEQVDAAIAAQSYEVSKVLRVLESHNAVPEDMLQREYYVSITVPVTVCVTVEAVDEDTAEEMARDYVESNGLEYYDMEYNTYYDAEYSVTEA
jgi:hypothetical protein